MRRQVVADTVRGLTARRRNRCERGRSASTFVTATVVAIVALTTAGIGAFRASSAAGATGAVSVTRVAPNSGLTGGGTRVTIIGTGFTGAGAVDFAGAAAASFSVNSATSITAIAPAGPAGVADITVTTGGAVSATGPQDVFTYYNPVPQITATSPSAGPSGGGTTVALTGNGLTGVSAVSFGSLPALGFTVNSGTSITATAPPGAATSTAQVTVTGPGGTSASNPNATFTYGPVVTGLSPNEGNYLGGTQVTILGAGFSGASAVDFAQTPATAFSVNQAGTQITATSPGGDAGAVDVEVTVGTVTTVPVAADQFTYVASGSPSAAVTVTVAAGQTPASTINEGLVGFNHPPPGSGTALAAVGTQWARTDVSFETSVNNQPVYNCATGAWNPQVLDANVAIDRQSGATPELIVDYTPPCLATNPPAGVNPNYTPPDIGPDMAKWQALVYQMALHEIGAEGVRVFEIWNEPNGQFWVAPDKLSAYLTLYQATATSLEAAASALGVQILVGGPALAEVNTTPDLSWIDGLCSFVVANNLPLDFVSWHEYANGSDVGPSTTFPSGLGPARNPDLDARSYGAGAASIRAEVAKYSTLHPLLWLDEWNVNAGEDPAMSGSYGAAFVAAVLDSAQSAGIDRATFYEAADDSALDNFGVLTQTLAPKFDYQAFAMWHSMAGAELGTAIAPNQTSANPQGRIGAVASISGGAISVLVYNFDPTGPAGSAGQPVPASLSHTVILRVTGLPAGQHYSVNRTLVDPSDNPSSPQSLGTVVAGGTLQFTQTGQSVSLLTLVPTS